MSQVDTSFQTFLIEKGYKLYVRTGLFRRKRTKTYDRASKKEKQEYNVWKQQKIKAAQDQQKALTELQESAERAIAEINKDVLNIKAEKSQREIDNIKRLEEIERIEVVNLSQDLSSYIKENPIEEKYPGLVESVTNSISEYANSFRDEESYAQVIVTDSINNSEEVLEQLNWLTLQPDSPTDVPLREVNTFGSWVLQTTGDVGLFDENTEFKTSAFKSTEDIKEKPQSKPLTGLGNPKPGGLFKKQNSGNVLGKIKDKDISRLDNEDIIRNIEFE